MQVTGVFNVSGTGSLFKQVGIPTVFFLNSCQELPEENRSYTGLKTTG